ncbi:hypothetical protein HPP92_015037 [Vanilla planifolia]|uniref:Uncharacterized protein n=1 Tax=Vanilla planifolia TaxID=51239 RepID=A0A835QH42_VANPL|nr:hypothetical protein HPP92_015037 [Vanilla planifolia]
MTIPFTAGFPKIPDLKDKQRFRFNMSLLESNIKDGVMQGRDSANHKLDSPNID